MNKRDLAIISMLLIVLVATRLPFLSPHITYYDSTEYVSLLSQGKFLAHPPGYVAFLYIGNLLMPLTGGNAGLSLTIESLLMAIVSILCFYFIGRMMFNQRTALISSLFFLVNPFFWHNSSIPQTYTFESAGACLVVLLLLIGMQRRQPRWFLLAGLALGLFSGVRLTLLIFMLPVTAYTMWRTEHRARGMAVLTTVFGCGIILGIIGWLAPTIAQYGSLSIYIHALSQQNSMAVMNSSVFVAGYLGLARNLLKYLGYFLYSFIFVGIYVAILRFGKRLDLEKPANEKLYFLALWIIPATIYYILIFLGPPGFLFSIFPAVYLILVGYLGQFKHVVSRNAAVFVSLTLAVLITTNSLLFLAVRPIEKPNTLISYLNVGLFMHSASALRDNYWEMPDFLK